MKLRKQTPLSAFAASANPRPGASRVAMAALCLAIVTSAGALFAGDVAPLAPSGSGAGGDSVGSLPLSAGNPPGGGSGVGRSGAAGQNGSAYAGHVMPVGPSRPVLTLVGTQSQLDALIFDAFGTGSIATTALANGRIRMEFHGRMTVELHRAQIQSSLVSVEILIGSSFHGGQAKVSVDHVFKAKQVLTAGTQVVRLWHLVQSGVVDQGLLWHAKSVNGVHSVLDFNDQGNLIRIQQRD